jgi:hypothetical protein
MEIAIILGIMTAIIGTVLATAVHFSTKQRTQTHR